MVTDEPTPTSGDRTDLQNLAEGQALDVDEALKDEKDDSVQLGGALTNEEARHITSRSRTSVIVLAGGAGSGKTTLLTTIYEHFLQEPLAGYYFAGSETLSGFERRSHPGRVISGLFVPRMETTHRLAPPWLHLAIRAVDLLSPAIDLLLADLSGEWFEELVMGKTPAEELPHVFRADHLSLILDGAKLAREGERDVERQHIEQLARFLVETESVVSPEALSIVVTKWDEVARAGSAAQDYADGAVLRVTKTAGLAEVPPYWRTAARPRTTDFPIGHGVPALFGYWVSKPRISVAHDFPLPRLQGPFLGFRATRPWPFRASEAT